MAFDDLTERLKHLNVPDLETRTALHAFYNKLIMEKCDEYQFGYVDDFSSFLSSSGTLDPQFIPSTRGSDHHLEPDLEPGPTRNLTTSILWERVAKAR